MAVESWHALRFQLLLLKSEEVKRGRPPGTPQFKRLVATHPCCPDWSAGGRGAAGSPYDAGGIPLPTAGSLGGPGCPSVMPPPGKGSGLAALKKQKHDYALLKHLL